ncbi:hypothetical protein [Chitinophaga cymbidii]|uniref:Inhibitor of vertebrate lysozyme (Ivy) n=1 Tax=Chitinophaga cymbidii TaxID=1096750 RepID=A0A512RM34_9BACT|nr:hypothetical protein [Chitinophaga cymbidii]GEP96732.1 hypothetical protein CCY01nite_29920 [Chitinophaga cymbidii]
MKHIAWTAAFAIFVYACQSTSSTQDQQQTPDSMTMIPTDTMIQITDTALTPTLVESWTAYEGFDGKYAADVKLLQQKPLKDRMKQLLGKEENDFIQRYKVTPPIEVESGVLFNEGCKPHNCTVEEAALAVDMKQDLLYVGIARNKVVTLFGERGDTAYPQKLRDWKKKFEEPVGAAQ